jgi:hypothetical protein
MREEREHTSTESNAYSDRNDPGVRLEKNDTRSKISQHIREIKEHCERRGCDLEDIFTSFTNKPKGKPYVVKDELIEGLNNKLPGLSREIEYTIDGFKNDKIARKEFMIYFGIKDAEAKIKIGE